MHGHRGANTCLSQGRPHPRCRQAMRAGSCVGSAAGPPSSSAAGPTRHDHRLQRELEAHGLEEAEFHNEVQQRDEEGPKGGACTQ